jgi:hypothetical protein
LSELTWLEALIEWMPGIHIPEKLFFVLNVLFLQLGCGTTLEEVIQGQRIGIV